MSETVKCWRDDCGRRGLKERMYHHKQVLWQRGVKKVYEQFECRECFEKNMSRSLRTIAIDRDRSCDPEE